MITTSANRIKQGPHWCEDADQITQEMFSGTDYTWDSEIEITWILEHAGLANTLLSLGAVRPRFQPHADGILLNYVRHLYSEVRKYAMDNGVESINVPHWINNPDRKQACAMEYIMWMENWAADNNVVRKKIDQIMALLFSEQKLVLKAVHATKFYLGLYAMEYGFKETDIVKQELRAYLKLQLDHYNV